MKYEIDGKIFDNKEEAIQYCGEEMISTANITELEDEDVERYCDKYPEDPRCKEHKKKIHGSIEENPEENPDETSEVITERELKEKLAISEALEDYNEYEDLGKKEILQQGLNITEDKTQGGRRLKGMPKRRTTKTAINDEYQEILEKLSNEEMISCPICNRLWTSIEKEMKENLEKENLSWREKYPELEGKFPTIRLIHLKAKHVGIWEFIKDLFEIPESDRKYDDFHRDDSESCSQEELSKEELSKRIIESPELRAKLFHRWKRELERE